ncbi:Zinc/iron permease [Heliocybe sulcata]|uniref:Zinc/iron permease n=1 Tax=Heliocybe sulcata TaxID=5364 RepID=A0A5C3N512_9AGAM|nr:Zinc/iron permease [Heliocybe sulcata]
MSAATGVLLMSVALGAASFGIGILPLSLNFTGTGLAGLSAVGTGLLLGAALGIIVPEGVEATAAAHNGDEFPTSKIALSLLVGFILMLVVEQTISSHNHGHSSSPGTKVLSSRSEVQFDADTEDIELGSSPRAAELSNADRLRSLASGEGRKEAVPLTVGLFIHGLADGLALGVSALSDSQAGHTSELSLVVFMAILIHKAPTTIAFTTSLLSTPLPRPELKKCIAVFASSTPLGALVSYALFYFLGAGTAGDMSGLALLVSGGSFLYVATVLQPVSDHSEGTSADLRKGTRTTLLVLGMVVPFLIAVFVGHDHGAENQASPP